MQTEREETKRTLIICAFHGTGKSYLYEHWNEDPYKILDLSMCSTESVLSLLERYIGTVDAILLSSSKSVIDTVIDAGYEIILVYPHFGYRQEYLERFREMGRGEMADYYQTRWKDTIRDLQHIYHPRIHHVVLENINSFLTTDTISRYLPLFSVAGE